MPRVLLRAALQSADGSILEAEPLEVSVGLSATELIDEQDLTADLTTAIEMAAALSVPVSLAANLGPPELAAALPVSAGLTADLTTAIAMSAALPVSVSLQGRIRSVQSGTWAPRSSPGDLFTATLTPSRNRASLQPSTNSAEADMVVP